MNSPSSSETTVHPWRIAEDEIDDAVRPAEVHRRLGALARQGRKPFTRASGQHDHQNVVANHRFPGPNISPDVTISSG
jgi:hypothetical protein